jgi:hypothetical protein
MIVRAAWLGIAVIFTALMFCGQVFAGSIDISIGTSAEVDRWVDGGPMPIHDGEVACTPAKFDDSAPCPSVVVANHSPEAVDLTFSIDEKEFASGMTGGMMLNGPGPKPCSVLNVHEHLEPGESCFEVIDFWPRDGEVHHATVHVIVKGKHLSLTKDLKIKGTSTYPPDLQAAEEVRQRHAAELKKIPKVASVELDQQDDGIMINITVEDADDIDEVRRQVPPKIEGYDTEVTEIVGHDYAL